MRLPFGIDLKSLIIGIIFAYFVLPRLMAAVTNLRSGSTSSS